jgi:DNA-binding LacI/PurR family transcriptional regulator
VPMAALASYGLTTIRQPVREMAKTAMEILGLASERGARSEPTTRLIPGTLITRSSTMNRRAVSHLKETAA